MAERRGEPGGSPGRGGGGLMSAGLAHGQRDSQERSAPSAGRPARHIVRGDKPAVHLPALGWRAGTLVEREHLHVERLPSPAGPDLQAADVPAFANLHRHCGPDRAFAGEQPAAPRPEAPKYSPGVGPGGQQVELPRAPAGRRKQLRVCPDEGGRPIGDIDTVAVKESFPDEHLQRLLVKPGRGPEPASVAHAGHRLHPVVHPVRLLHAHRHDPVPVDRAAA